MDKLSNMICFKRKVLVETLTEKLSAQNCDNKLNAAREDHVY